MERISKNCSYKEAVHSDTAKRLDIINEPNEEQLVFMRDLATRIFEPIREHFSVPIYISSFFRSSVLNKAIKGSTSSQHLKGQAIDIDADIYGKVTNKQIFEYIKDNLEFDQLIAEGLIEGSDNPAWIHCSYVNGNNRREILVHTVINKKAKYYIYDPKKKLNISLYK